MIEGIKRLFCANIRDMAVLKWLSVGHDIWNTMIMDGALSSSVKVMTRDMEVYTIAAVLRKNNATHKAK